MKVLQKGRLVRF